MKHKGAQRRGHQPAVHLPQQPTEPRRREPGRQTAGDDSVTYAVQPAGRARQGEARPFVKGDAAQAHRVQAGVMAVGHLHFAQDADAAQHGVQSALPTPRPRSSGVTAK